MIGPRAVEGCGRALAWRYCDLRLSPMLLIGLCSRYRSAINSWLGVVSSDVVALKLQVSEG